MDVTIHRGTRQIGGCVTEIATQKTRLMIDFGAELPNGGETPRVIEVEGVNSAGRVCDAVLFTHYHGDHIGMLDQIHPDVPTYMSEVSKQIMRTVLRRTKAAHLSCLEKVDTFIPLRPFVIGDIKITPIPADHSAYDACMFLLEADGKKVLHTGDFRLHGFRSKGTKKIFKKYVGAVDMLITEGTTLSRGDVFVQKEIALQKDIRKVVSEYKYVFVLCASTNIDRLALLHNVTPIGRYFVCDGYQKEIMSIVAEETKSNSYLFKKALIYGENLALKERGFVMPVRQGSFFKSIMGRYVDDEKTILIYSMWDGYLEDKEDSSMRDFVQLYHDAGKMKIMHTSGHATPEAIRSICELTSAKYVLPIHTEMPENIQTLCPDAEVVLPEDGVRFKIT